MWWFGGLGVGFFRCGDDEGVRWGMGRVTYMVWEGQGGVCMMDVGYIAWDGVWERILECSISGILIS